jgi:hypothetical protein
MIAAQSSGSVKVFGGLPSRPADAPTVLGGPGIGEHRIHQIEVDRGSWAGWLGAGPQQRWDQDHRDGKVHAGESGPGGQVEAGAAEWNERDQGQRGEHDPEGAGMSGESFQDGQDGSSEGSGEGRHSDDGAKADGDSGVLGWSMSCSGCPRTDTATIQMSIGAATAAVTAIRRRERR